MLVANRICSEYTSPWDTHRCVCVHVVLIILVLSNASTHRWVMTDLFCEVFEVMTNQLECFTENWIKWLWSAIIRTLILCNTKCRYKHKSSQLIVAFICFIKQILVLHDFSHFLNHRYRFIKVDRDTKTWQIFTNSVLQNRPHWWFVLWVL